MTFIPSVRGIVDTNNSNTTLNETAWNAYSGTVVSATTSTIVLDSSASAVDDAYNNMAIEIYSGTGINRFYTISDYTGSSKTCNIDQYIEIIPDTTSLFIIHSVSGTCTSQTQSNIFKTIKLNGTSQSFDDLYIECIGT